MNVVRGDGLERFRLLLPVPPRKRRCGLDALHLLAVDADGRNEHEVIGIVIRRRRQEHAPDETKDGGGGADADRKRESRNRGKRRLLEQHANSEAEILQHDAS